MKAQGSVEFIITASIVLVLVGVAVSIATGTNYIYNIDVLTSTRYWEAQDIGIVSYSQGNTQFLMTLQNNLDHDVQMNRIDLVTETEVFNTSLGSTSISPGDQYSITLSKAPDTATFGTRFSYDVVLYYTDPRTGTSIQLYGQYPLRGELAS